MFLFGEKTTPDFNAGNEIAQAAYAFSGVPALSSDNDGSSEAWLAFLKEFAGQTEEAEPMPRVHREEGAGLAVVSAPGPLRKLEPGPWRSLGGYFDYSAWEDRERFLELDRAIEAGRSQGDSEEECDAGIFGRGVSTDQVAA